MVTAVTYRLHPTPPSGYVGLYMTVGFLAGLNSSVTWFDAMLYLMPLLLNTTLSGGVWAGVRYCNPPPHSH